MMEPPFTVVESEAKGRCLRATRDIPQGEVILQTLPYAIGLAQPHKKVPQTRVRAQVTV
jgi:hypothetical protein